MLGLSEIVPFLVWFQGLLFAAFLLLGRRQYGKRSNFYLALFSLILSVQAGEMILRNLEILPQFYLDNYCFYGFVYGPLLYLYTRSSLETSRAITKDILHFLPAALVFFSPVVYPQFCLQMGMSLYFSLFLYCLLSLLNIRRYWEVVRRVRSSAKEEQSRWLIWVILIFLSVVILDFIDNVIFKIYLLQGLSLTSIVLLLMVNVFFFKAMLFPDIFKQISQVDKELATVLEIGKGDIKQPQSPSVQEKEDLQRIKNLIQDKKLFSNPALSLNQLADEMGLPARYISGLINSYQGKNFMTFINEFRICCAKDLIETNEDPGYTIAEAMYESGFNSKSSFNTLFKKLVGQTPSEFRKNHGKAYNKM